MTKPRSFDTHRTIGEDRPDAAGRSTGDGVGGGRRSHRSAAHSRRTVLGAGLAAGGAAATRFWFRQGAAAQAATPAASPTPDASGRIPGGAPGVPDAYVRLPDPFRSVAAVPGTGAPVTSLAINYGTPVTAKGENRYWQELDRALGVSFEMALIPEATWAERFATTIAGGDLPDLMVYGVGEANTGQLIQQGAFTDLTDYLTGDALQEYPNLARFDPLVWERSAINRRNYAVPRTGVISFGGVMFRQDWADTVGIPKPANADEFFELLTRFTRGDPDGNGSADTWGLVGFNTPFFPALFGAPNGWRLEPDGTLTGQVETEEYRQGIEFQRRLFEAGLFHPDVATITGSQAKDLHAAGTIGGYWDNILALPGAGGQRARARQVNPNAEVVILEPFGAAGGPGITYNGVGYWGQTAIPATVGEDPARVRELLRIVDYFAAPFGSEERIFLDNGLEGVHHTVRPDGTRELTDQGRNDIGFLNSLCNGPTAYYFSDEPGQAEYMQSVHRFQMAVGVDNPTYGFYSPSSGELSSELGQLITDGTLSIIQGREPLDALDRVVADWRSRGGDQIRREYQEAMAAQ